MRSGFSMTGTSAEIYGKKEILRLATEFSISFTSLLSNIEDNISENLPNLNLIYLALFTFSLDEGVSSHKKRGSNIHHST